MTAEQYVVKITYQTPPYANTGNTNTVFYVSGKEVVATSQSNTVFYVSGKEVYATSPLLLNARKYESQYKWVLQHKPTCTEESVECLTEQLDWVHDSIATASKLTPERLKIINTLNSNDSAHIRLLKNDLNYLRNQNKQEN